MQRVGVVVLSLSVPAYIPTVVCPVLPWARRHVARVAAHYQASLDDLWDEAVTALLRAAVYYDAAAGAFGPYARTAVHRACARAVHVGQRRRTGTLHTVSFEDVPALDVATPSAEAEAIAREAVHQAWVLREHASLASSRGDTETATRLEAAAAAADARATPPTDAAPIRRLEADVHAAELRP
jgi:hypothetical protein